MKLFRRKENEVPQPLEPDPEVGYPEWESSSDDFDDGAFARAIAEGRERDPDFYDDADVA
jgi:hypothetical protein